MRTILNVVLAIVFAFALPIVLATLSHAQDSDTLQTGIQNIRLNVFLRQWQVLGPLPMETSGEAALEREYFENEAAFRGGNVRFHSNRLFTWTDIDTRLVDLRETLAPGTGGENCVGYAWTQFVSDSDQTLRMAIAHDDMCAVWLNGELVGRNMSNKPSELDQVTYDVDVKQGVNSLLLKVTNGTKQWDFAVRFLPIDVQTPLVRFQCMPDVSRPDFPVVGIQILDASGKTLAEHLCSGTRISWFTAGTYYRLYAPMPVGMLSPAGKPHAVRFVAKHPGFADFSQTYSWEEARSGAVELEFQADRPVQLVATDVNSGKPISGAVVWDQKNSCDQVTDSKGAVSLPNFQPTVPECWVSAPGYLAKQVKLDWPRRKTHKVQLTPGGCTVVGQVVSDSGEPIANATIKTRATSYPAFQPVLKSDENGRFRMHGFLPNKPEFKATVSARGYVTNDQIEFTISPTQPTEVKWQLAAGVLVSGIVTHAATGKPVVGVEVLGGESRYDGNKATGTTNKNGEFLLVASDPGSLTVTALSDHYAPAMKTITTQRGVETKVDLQIDEGTTFRGITKDQTGKPVANARIIVNSWNGKRGFTRDVRSDSKGEFVLLNMPQGDFETYAVLDGYVTLRSIPLVADELIEVTLAKEVNLTYRITADGKVVPNLSITRGYKFSGQTEYSWQPGSSMTSRMYNSSTGEFTVATNNSNTYTTAYRFVGNGLSEKIVEIPDDATESQAIEINLEPADLFRGVVIAPESGQPRPGIAVTLVSQSDLLNPSGYNAETIWQYMTGSRYSGTYAITDAKGMFQLNAPPAEKRVEFVLASSDGGFHHVGNLPDGLFSSSDTSVTLPFPEPAEIQGTYTIDGKPIANQIIRIAWSGPSGRGNNGRTFFTAAMRATTDADGKFQSVKLAPGRYQISRVMTFQRADSISHSAYVGQDNVVLLPGETKTYALDIPQGFSISGVVNDPDGKPLPTVFIDARADKGTVAATMTDGEGRFKLEHLAAGTLVLSSQYYARDSDGSYRSKFSSNQSVQVIDSIDDLEFNLNDADDNSAMVYQAPNAQQIAGKLAPKFRLTTIDPPLKHDSDQLIGKVVVICFWQTHSQDLATIEKVYQQYRDNPDVAFLTVGLGTDLDEIKTWMKQQQVDFPVAYYDLLKDQSQLPYMMGAHQAPGCIVIDREGRFASETIQSQQLATAIQTALAKKLSKTNTARLKIHASAGQHAMPVAGAKLTLQSYDETGQVVTQDEYDCRVLRDVTWHYPAVGEGGKLVATISGDGMQLQLRTIANPVANEQLLLECPAPRKLLGRITDQDNKPVASMKLLVYGFNTGTYLATTDEKGNYSVGCFPGRYQLMPQSNDSFAVAVQNGQLVMVTLDKDPAVVNFRASPAITIRGKVLDANGNAATGGMVMTGSSTRVSIGQDGTYVLPGIPSIGTSIVMAIIDNQYGQIQITNPQAISNDGNKAQAKKYDIQIGKGFENGNDSAAIVNVDATPLELQTLAGQPVQWKPTDADTRCLLFCSLWHPQSANLIKAAQAEAKKNNAMLQILSLDFTRQQAVRQSQRLELTNVLYAGAAGLALPDPWTITNDYRFVIVAPDGKLESQSLSVAK